MPTLETKAFLELLDRHPEGVLRIVGIQNGNFNLLLDLNGTSHIHSDVSDAVKQYRHVEQILDWLRRKSSRISIQVDFALWNNDNR